MTLLVLLALIIVLAVYIIALYNGLVRARNAVKNAWSQIDVQLKRRHDLIPNLVETVKGYVTHERGTLEAVVKARQQAVSATGGVEERAKAENALTQSLRSLLAVAEAYPDFNAFTAAERVAEAEATGAQALVTACGWCERNFNDAIAAVTASNI